MIILQRIHPTTAPIWVCVWGGEFGMVKVNSAMKKKKWFIYPPSIVQTLEELACGVQNYADELNVFAKLDIGGLKHRASPHFQGKPWCDWALFRRTRVNEGFAKRIVPVHMHCLVDLRFLQQPTPPNLIQKSTL